MEQDNSRADIAGSREPDPSFTGSGPAGFDPGRIVQVEFIQPKVSVENTDRDGLCTGDRYIWIRHEGRPHLDALLATVHYNYAYHDNCTIGGVAERVAEVIRGRGPAIAIETREGGNRETECRAKHESAGPKDIAQPTGDLG